MKYLLFTFALFIFVTTNGFSQEKEGIIIKKAGKSSTMSFDIKEEAKPDVYIDGIKYDANIVDLLDKDLIATINVYKGDEAFRKYKSKNGVIEIISKNNITSEKSNIQIKNKDGKFEIQNEVDPSKKPLVIVDGKEHSHDALKELNPDDIESINVLKGDKAMQEYKAENGVIIINTKKKRD